MNGVIAKPFLTSETSIVRQQLGKQVSEAIDTQATIEEFFGTTFSIRYVQSGYKEEFS
jgi:hypothetical protein